MIDLSADLAEGAPDEQEIWPLIASANVACGGHYGNDETMTAAVESAQKHHVRLGAHPSYPDPANFGRVSMKIDHGELFTSLLDQLSALALIADRHGVAMEHVKPHGALYNDAHRRRPLADVIVDAISDVNEDMALVAPATSQMALAAESRHLRVIREAFADRRYEPDGSLVARSIPGSLLTVEESAVQAEMLAREGHVIARDGSRLPILFDTLCVHSDMPGAVERLRAIRARFA